MPSDDATAALASLRAAVARIESGEAPEPPAVSTVSPVGATNATTPDVAADERLSSDGTPDDGRAPWETGGRAPSWREASREAPDLKADGTPEDEQTRAREIVLRSLSQAPRTRKQLADRLRAKGIDDEVAGRVLDRMEEVQLVDDTAYADALVRTRQAGRGLARRALAHELRTKGVPDDVAAAALDTVDPSAERRRAVELVHQRLARMHGLAREVQVRRLAGMLARKGYPGDVAHSVIRGVLDEAPEHQRD